MKNRVDCGFVRSEELEVLLRRLPLQHPHRAISPPPPQSLHQLHQINIFSSSRGTYHQLTCKILIGILRSLSRVLDQSQR